MAPVPDWRRGPLSVKPCAEGVHLKTARTPAGLAWGAFIIHSFGASQFTDQGQRTHNCLTCKQSEWHGTGARLVLWPHVCEAMRGGSSFKDCTVHQQGWPGRHRSLLSSSIPSVLASSQIRGGMQICRDGEHLHQARVRAGMLDITEVTSMRPIHGYL